MAGGLLLAALATAVAPAGPAPDSPEVLTLPQAIELALAAHPGVRASSLAAQRAERNVSAARTSYFPTLSLEASVGGLLVPVESDFPQGAFGTLPGVGEIPPTDTTVKSTTNATLNVSSTLAQPLTQLFRVHQNLRAARSAADASREQLRAERAAVAADVKRAYYAILAGQAELAAAEEQVATSRELARMATQLVTREAALEHDALEARGGLAQATLHSLRVRNGLATSKEQLNRLLGRDVRTAFVVAPLPEQALEEVDLDAARERALRDRPEVRQARELVEQADADRSAKRTEYLPDVSLFVSYSSYFNVDILPRNVALAGVQLKWDPFTWGRRENEVEGKALAVEEARAKAREAEQAVLVEVGDRYRKLQEARAAVEASELVLATLRAKAPVIERRQRVEAALLKDVLDTRAQLARAAHDHQQAILSLWSAKADFEKAIGDAP